MNVKTLSLKLAGGLLALTIGVTAMAGHTSSASADSGILCTPPACPIIDIRADLRPQNLSVQKVGDKLWVSFQINDQGKLDAHSFKTRVLLNGQPVPPHFSVMPPSADPLPLYAAYLVESARC